MEYKYIEEILSHSISTKEKILENTDLIEKIILASNKMKDSIQNGGKIIFAGNGGSAADSQHLAAEFVSKLSIPRDPLPSIAITTDTSALTAIGNDYGFDNVFLRQLVAISSNKDIFVGITTSGKSPNILNCLEYSKRNDIFSILLTGKDVKNPHADLIIDIPSNNVARIQECHITIGHILCGLVEKDFI
tara:strand:- start:579 stop:1148 length:570 start_codon:yes stop_codon:yes gene_type:complete